MSGPAIPVDDVRMMLRVAGAAFELGDRLLSFAEQRYPELRREDPGPLDEVEQARARAVERTKGG